jgi:hypothetical protein
MIGIRNRVLILQIASSANLASSYRSNPCIKRERSGMLEDWLKGMNIAEISNLIDQLKAR